MTVDRISSKVLEERMHIGSRAEEAITRELARAVARKTVVESHPAAKASEAGAPVEQADKGRIIKETA